MAPHATHKEGLVFFTSTRHPVLPQHPVSRMEKSRYKFAADLPEPIDSSRIVTRLHRPSFDDLRSQTASPSASMMGIYVRSRAAAPYDESQDRSEYTEHQSHRKMSWTPNPHLGTSFAAVSAEKRAVIASSSFSATLDNQQREPDVRRAGWDYRETRSPPPGYNALIESDEDQVLYMQDERMARAAQVLRHMDSQSQFQSQSRPLPQLPLECQSPVEQFFTSPQTPSSHSPMSIADSTRTTSDTTTATSPISRASSWTSYTSGRPASAATMAPIRTIRRMQEVEDLRATISFLNMAGDNEESEPGPEPAKRTKILGAYKFIRRTFDWHRRAFSSDAVSERSIAAPSSSSADAGNEEVKSSSVSLFNLRTRSESIKSQNASLFSDTVSKGKDSKGKNVLVKTRKSQTFPQPSTSKLPAPGTAMLTSSSRGIQNKALRRRSVSFSGYTVVENRESFQLPEEMKSDPVMQEVKTVVDKQAQGDWVYIEAGPSSVKRRDAIRK